MKTKSATLGKNISEVEVTNISKHGLWLLINHEEVFVAFKHFPWFKDAPINDLLNVQLNQPDHLYWPTLDIDLSVESIHHPDRFPLISKLSRKKR